MQILPDRIVWDREDFLTGFIADPSSSFRYHETGAANMQNIDVFTNSPGTLLVGANAISVGTVNTTALIDATMDPTTAKAYLLGTDLHRFDTGVTDAMDKDSTWPRSILHNGGTASGTAGQVVFYHTNGTAKAIFYSYNTGTLGDVGVYDISADSFNDKFMSTVPTSAGTMSNVMHPMLVTSDDLLLMGDFTASQGKIHQYKGLTNTRSTNVLNLPYNMQPVGIVEEENGFDTVVFATTAQGTNRRGLSKAFWWSVDRPASWYKSSPIPDDECAAPFAAFGTVGCFTRSRTSSGNAGSSRLSVLRLYIDGTWKPVFHWVGTLPSVGGVDIQDNTVIWNSDGIRYRWGEKWGKYPAAAFQEATGSGTTSGMLKSLSNATTTAKLYMSSGTGASGLERFGQFTTGNWQGCAAAPLFPFGKKGKVTGVQIYVVGGSGGGGRAISLGLMNEAFASQEVFSGLTSFTSTEPLRKYLPENFTVRLIEFSAISPYLQWTAGSGATNASGVERIEVFFESIDIRT